MYGTQATTCLGCIQMFLDTPPTSFQTDGNYLCELTTITSKYNCYFNNVAGATLPTVKTAFHGKYIRDTIVLATPANCASNSYPSSFLTGCAFQCDQAGYYDGLLT